MRGGKELHAIDGPERIGPCAAKMKQRSCVPRKPRRRRTWPAWRGCRADLALVDREGRVRETWIDAIAAIAA